MRECSAARPAGQDADAGMATPPPAYAELHCLSDFTFLRGASSAAQLFERARACGYQALAITDTTRSEERRVGKECRSRWSPYH